MHATSLVAHERLPLRRQHEISRSTHSGSANEWSSSATSSRALGRAHSPLRDAATPPRSGAAACGGRHEARCAGRSARCPPAGGRCRPSWTGRSATDEAIDPSLTPGGLATAVSTAYCGPGQDRVDRARPPGDVGTVEPPARSSAGVVTASLRLPSPLSICPLYERMPLPKHEALPVTVAQGKAHRRREGPGERVCASAQGGGP